MSVPCNSKTIIFYSKLIISNNIVLVDALDGSYINIQKANWMSKKSFNQGSFAKVDTPKDTVYSLYSGRITNPEETVLYEKLRKEQIQQVRDDKSNDPDAAEDFAESTWMNK